MIEKQKMSVRRRRTHAEVQQLIAEFVSSGMRRTEFCRSRGLSFGTLNRHLKKQRWKRKSRRASSAGRVGRLVPVELAARKSPTQHEPSCGLAVVLSGGRRIEVHPDFDTKYVPAPGECAGAGLNRVWIGSTHTDLSGRRGHRHAQGFRGAVRL